MAPREGVVIARGKGGGLPGLADAVGRLWDLVWIRRSRLPPREGISTGLGARFPGLGVLRLGTWAPALHWSTPCGSGPIVADMVVDRADDLSSQATGREIGDEGIARAQDEPLLAARTRDPPRPAGTAAGASAPGRRDGSGGESMPPVDPRASSPIRSGDVPMVDGDGDGVTPAPGRDASPPDASMPDGSGGGEGSAPVPPPAEGAPTVGGALGGRGRSRATVGLGSGARMAGPRPSSWPRVTRRPAVIAFWSSRVVRSGCPLSSTHEATGPATGISIASLMGCTRWTRWNTSWPCLASSLPALRRYGSPRRTWAPPCSLLCSPGL